MNGRGILSQFSIHWSSRKGTTDLADISKWCCLLLFFFSARCGYRAPQHGSVENEKSRVGNYFRHGGEVKYKCNAGYSMVGSATITCSEGRWSAALLQCKGTQLGSNNKFEVSWHSGNTFLCLLRASAVDTRNPCLDYCEHMEFCSCSEYMLIEVYMGRRGSSVHQMIPMKIAQ